MANTRVTGGGIYLIKISRFEPRQSDEAHSFRHRHGLQSDDVDSVRPQHELQSDEVPDSFRHRHEFQSGDVDNVRSQYELQSDEVDPNKPDYTKSSADDNDTQCGFLSHRKAFSIGILLTIIVIGTIIGIVFGVTNADKKDIGDCSSIQCGNGTCIDGVNDYRCLCDPGFKGTNCEFNIDECSSSPCGNGTCNDGINIDECSSSPCGNGTCIDGINRYRCSCDNGFNGTNCEHNMDECISSPCIKGICIDDINKYRCSCDDGFNGINCEHNIDECSSSPCGNGTCIDAISNYSCSCDKGFNGTNCEHNIDECSSSLCGNGTCIDGINSYRCSCDDGFKGLNCEYNIDECSSSPCEHGSCFDGINNYRCSCNDGFNGTNCEHNIDECISSPCGNGTCIDGINDYRCSCDDGFTGTNCDYMLSDCLNILRYDGNSTDGVYTIRTGNGHQHFDVYCDMSTDGGGWTVFQHRFDGTVDFYRNFTEYETGFGHLTTEFWLGLNYIQELAGQDQTDLRIDLEAANGTKAYETFDKFSLSLGPSYTLYLGSTIASSGISRTNDFASVHYGIDFSTFDHDADNANDNCAIKHHGAWWYRHCYTANLNGQYLTPGTFSSKGMNYISFMGYKSLKSSKMMMRKQ